MTATDDRRNRVHMPVAFDPTNYEYVGGFDNAAGDPGARAGSLESFTEYGRTVQAYSPIGARRRALQELLAESSTSRYEHDRGQQCDHCGAHIRYVAVLRHTPTGDHIASGEQCLAERFSLQSKAEFDEMRRMAAEERAEHRVLNNVNAFFDANPDLHEVLWPVPDAWDGTYASTVLHDMARKLRRYGELSDRQAAYARRLAVQAPEELARAAQRDIDRLTADPAPEGRNHVEGVIVSRRLHETAFGVVHKLTVRDDRGFRVWVSEPSAARTQRGDRVEFDANLTRSNDDETFAFGKRPTRFTVLWTEDEQESA